MSLDIYLKNPLKEEEDDNDEYEREYVYDGNITHNCYGLANRLGIGDHLWNPREIGIEKASDMPIELLKNAAQELHANLDHYTQFDPENGWGKAKHFLPFLKEYIEALESNPDAELTTCG